MQDEDSLSALKDDYLNGKHSRLNYDGVGVDDVVFAGGVFSYLQLLGGPGLAQCRQDYRMSGETFLT